MRKREVFYKSLVEELRDATEKGFPYIDIRAGDLHRKVGGYPGNHRMPVCCSVMRSSMNDGDEIREQPPKGDGANLVIRYKIPRLGIEKKVACQYWLEQYWPSPNRDLSALYIWFHEKKQRRNEIIRDGDRVLFYQVGKHPSENFKGAKAVFASGTVLNETIWIPKGQQLRGNKRWIFKRSVIPDYAVPPDHGIRLSEVKGILGFKKWPQTGFQIEDPEKFNKIESRLQKRQEEYNQKAFSRVKKKTPFRQKALTQMQASGKIYDEGNRIAALEKSLNAHQDLLNRLSRVIGAHKHSVSENQKVDLFAVVDGVSWIFEVKSTNGSNFLSQVRGGIAQLFEYRFLYSKPAQGAKLCLVVQTPPPEELLWIVEYLRSLGICLCWPVPDGFYSAYGKQYDFLKR